MKIVVSNNSFVYDELASPGFRLVHAEPIIVSSGDEALAMAREHQPELVVLDADLPGIDGYEVCAQIKADDKLSALRVILVVQGSVSSKQLQRLATCGCDDVLMYKLPGETLYNHAARLLGLPDPSLGLPVQLTVSIAGNETSEITAHAVKLSRTEIEVICGEKLVRGAELTLELARNDSAASLTLSGRVVRSEVDRLLGSHLAVIVFQNVTVRDRARLADMALWDARNLPAGVRVTIRGDFDESTDFSAVLIPEGTTNVIFDIGGIRWINSWGARKWIMFLRSLPSTYTYSFVNASPVFVKHCNMVSDMVGSGEVLSFAAPYECKSCSNENNRVLQVSSMSPAMIHEPPEFRCPLCGGIERFDEIPERYFAFLSLPQR